jgi:hypothetical protein
VVRPLGGGRAKSCARGERGLCSGPNRVCFALLNQVSQQGQQSPACLEQVVQTAGRGLNRRQRKAEAHPALRSPIRRSKKISQSAARRKKGGRQEQGLNSLTPPRHHRTKIACVGEAGLLCTETDFASFDEFDCAKKQEIWCGF